MESGGPFRREDRRENVRAALRSQPSFGRWRSSTAALYTPTRTAVRADGIGREYLFSPRKGRRSSKPAQSPTHKKYRCWQRPGESNPRVGFYDCALRTKNSCLWRASSGSPRNTVEAYPARSFEPAPELVSRGARPQRGWHRRLNCAAAGPRAVLPGNRAAYRGKGGSWAPEAYTGSCRGGIEERKNRLTQL